MRNNIFMRFPDFKWKALTLSYDDGVVFDKKLMEIMDKHGLKGTFNLNSGRFAPKDGEWCLTKEAALALYKHSPHEVAIHGEKHYSLSLVDEPMAINDVLTDRKNLEKMFGRIVQGMAYANGHLDDTTVETLKKCGIKYARTIVSTGNFEMPTDWLRLPATCHHNDPRLMELAKQFVTAEESPYYWGRTCKMFYLWGHSYEFNNQDNWQVIEDFAAYMGGREDIWYATNGEIYDYVEAFDRLVFSVDGDRIFNPTATTLYINYFNKEYIIKPGETIEVSGWEG